MIATFQIPNKISVPVPTNGSGFQWAGKVSPTLLVSFSPSRILLKWGCSEISISRSLLAPGAGVVGAGVTGGVVAVPLAFTGGAVGTVGVVGVVVVGVTGGATKNAKTNAKSAVKLS